MAVLQKITYSDPLYREVEERFKARWVNPEKRLPSVRAIYKVVLKSDRAQYHSQQYKRYLERLQSQRPGNKLVEEKLFHGQVRACNIGDDNGRAPVTTPCSSPQCAVCHILQCDFADGAAKKNGFFGRGIYTTTASNKADYFCRNVNSNSPYRFVFMSKVAVGKPSLLGSKNENLNQAPSGYDSVQALTTDAGGVVKYSERVVYQDEAMCPYVAIVYSL
ncbi:hypothetical protein SERLA73DRAFT_175727 [Serpula lacrymans var. lacrymans S7.3]|uniref:PARP catalytic domain-containing protein n=2 Tax=Serpula lacrymans var. lacrymans TaxID=341189 RepID=F8PL96_SERL3|nr:uncharacterized protein SERLADRAFT_458303 [Serpula lacrymans var. lacrymans S7.9]EGO04004.1 hypothetical protein SERLA73DRAFT_175727 [Serpula lacrymans var. lacrymans S7.3]EGO29924.1 hypothetical protein SERLADRAFT_458303 [Serpula lacrymans var. lacrymans S7.9]